MDVTVKYEGTSGENLGGLTYFYLKFVSPEFKKVRVENIVIEPPSSRNQVYPSYIHVYDKDTLEYICSSSNATRALIPPDNLPGIWKFEKRLLLENDKNYLFTFTTSSAPSLTNLYATRMKIWPSTTEAGALDVNSRGSGTATYPGTEISFYPAMTFQGEAVPVSGGSITIGQGYCNVDGINKIIFPNTVKKDFEDIGGTKGFKNNVVLTLDNSDVSSFILQGVEAEEPTEYKSIKALDKAVYLSNNKDMILGDSSKEGLEVSLTDSKINCEIIGTPTVSDDFVVSDFSSSNYLRLPESFPGGNIDAELFFHIKTKYSGVSYPNLIAHENYGNRCFTLFYAPNNVFAMGLPGYSSDKLIIPSISDNTEYWIKVEMLNSQNSLKCSYSTDGISFTQTVSDAFSLNIQAGNLLIGILNSSKPFAGFVYLKDCYIKINGTEWWRGAEKKRINVSEGYSYISELEGSLILEEYKSYTTPQEILVHPEDFETVAADFVQPVLTANGTIGGSSFAVASDSDVDGGRVAWRAFDGDSSTYWHSAQGLPHWLEFYNPEELLVKEFSFCNGPNSSVLPIGHFEIQYSFDGSIWNKVYEADNPVTDATTRIYADLSNNTIAAKYWRIWTNTQNPTSVLPNYIQMNEVRIVAKVGSAKLGYLSLANPSGTTKLVATGMRNPTKEYAGSVATPADLAKKMTLSEDFSEILTVEDI